MEGYDMNFPEIEKFIAWYRMKKETKGLSLPIYYCFKKGSFVITDKTMTQIQLIMFGVTKISPANILTLEAIFQLLNTINDRTKKDSSIPRPDVF